MNLITKASCKLIGWNPEILKDCREISYAKLRRYIAAIVILSTIWGIIGWNFADNYLAIESWYGKAIASAFFVTIIICVERYIILSYGELGWLTFFRFCLACIVAILGATILDQIIFKDDIETQMIEIKNERREKAIKDRTQEIDKQIEETLVRINNLTEANEKLKGEIAKEPFIETVEVTYKRRQVGEDSEGKPIYEYERIVVRRPVPNPKQKDVDKNEEILKELRNTETKQQQTKLELIDEIYQKHEQSKTGFLEELDAMFSLAFSNWIVGIFYFLFFLFFFFLELLVILTKGRKGRESCDYEFLIHFQFEQRKKQLEALGNQKEFINVDNI